MFTIEWLARDGEVLDRDVSVADDVALAHGKAVGRAIYQTRKRAAPPAAYRIFDAEGRQVAAATLQPADLQAPKWVAGPASL